MLTENMKMAFSVIRASKIRSVSIMLGIIIGIGSIISIASIGSTIGELFADLYKDANIIQAYVPVGYWLDDVRQSDYFTLDGMERVREVFEGEVVYINNSAYISTDASYKHTKIKFEFQGIDCDYQDVQPVNMIYSRYLNGENILGRRKNVVMDTDSTLELFGIENAVGKSFRITIYGSTEDSTAMGVYRKNVNTFQALMMSGSNSGKGIVFVPYTLLTWPSDYLYRLHVYAKNDVSLDQFLKRFKAHVAKMHGGQMEDMYMCMAVQKMTSAGIMTGGLSMAVGDTAAISLLVGGASIMSTMLVFVTEQTREIGIRKTLGARTQSVLIQFLTESAILLTCGGIIGVVMGMGLMSLGGLALGMSVIMKPRVILVAVSSSAMVGIFFGLYPASKAAKSDPIDTLRCE